MRQLMTTEPTCAACDQLIRSLCVHHMISTHPALYTCAWQTARLASAAPVDKPRPSQWPPDDLGQAKEFA